MHVQSCCFPIKTCFFNVLVTVTVHFAQAPYYLSISVEPEQVYHGSISGECLDSRAAWAPFISFETRSEFLLFNNMILARFFSLMMFDV